MQFYGTGNPELDAELIVNAELIAALAPATPTDDLERMVEEWGRLMEIAPNHPYKAVVDPLLGRLRREIDGREPS